MNGEQLLDKLGLTEAELVAEADQARRRRPVWLRYVRTAAILLLVLLVGAEAYLHFGSAKSKEPLTTGQWTSEAYYYMGDGVWCYVPGGEAEQLLRDGQFDWWAANDYGLYYTTGRRLYVRVWATGETERLYWAPIWCQKLDFRVHLRVDGDVEVMPVSRVFGCGTTKYLDGQTGDECDCVFECRTEADYLAADMVNNDTFLSVVMLEEGKYYLVIGESGVMCREVATGESWDLALDAAGVTLQKGLTNGTYLITGEDWYHSQACWEIVYDEAGRPVELRLVSRNIEGE